MFRGALQTLFGAALSPAADDRMSPDDWERHLAARMLTDRPSAPALRRRSCSTSGLCHGELVASFRRGAPPTCYNCTRLLNAIGEQAARSAHALFRRAAGDYPPTGAGLTFLEADLPAVPAGACYLQALVEADADSRIVRVTIEKDIDTMLDDIVSGGLPGSSSDRPPTLIEIGVDPTPFVRRVAAVE